MGIIDRDYMKRDTDKKVKDSTYNPKEFRDSKNAYSNESDFDPPRQNREKPRNEKTRINLGKSKKSEDKSDQANYQQSPKQHINDAVDAEWWDGKQWRIGIKEPEITEERPWVRPWLWHVFIFMLVVFAINKAVEFSKEWRTRSSQEREAIQLERQQEATRLAQAYKSPYANMPRLPEYTRPHSEPQKPKTEAQPAPLMRAPERPPSIIVREGVTVLEGSKDGHYFSSGTVNGFPVVFMVDTGATTVSISMDTAERAGIQECTLARFRTANGDTDGCRTVVPMIEFGNYKVSNVEVAIMRNLTTHSLLGMNVLKLFKMQQHENRLFFSPNT